MTSKSFNGPKGDNAALVLLRLFGGTQRGCLTLLTLSTLCWIQVAGQSHAATQSWTGGGTSANWSEPANWSGAAVPAAGDNLLFSGPGGLANTNDLTTFTNTGWICFANGDFTSGGDTLSFTTAAGITNLGGDNELGMDLQYPSLSGAVPVSVSGGSTLRVSGNITNLSGNGNSGLFSKSGAGMLVLSGGAKWWNAGAFVREGAFVLNGGNLYITNSSNGNIRLSCAAGAGPARLVISNEAVVTLAANNGSLLVGRSGGTATNVVDMYSGTLTLPGNTGRIVMGQDNGNSAVFNQYDGLVDVAGLSGTGGEVRVGYTGTNLTATYNLNGGVLRARTVIRTTTNNTGIFNFNGGTLRATTNITTFLQSLSSVNVQDGGAIIDSQGFDITISLRLKAGGAGGLTKLGAGTLTLNGSNTYTGPTLVSGGELQVNGSLGKGTVTVDGATLSGGGTIGGPVAVLAGGQLTPGPGSVGVLSCADNVTLQGTTTMELNRSQPEFCDELVASNVVYGGELVVVNNGPQLAAGDRFKLFDAGAYSGSFTNIVLPPLDEGLGLTWSNSLSQDGTLSVVGATYSFARSNVLARTKYNILFIAVDDLKPLIGAFGDPGGHPPNYPLPRTPNMDAIAARGMLFTRAYCQMALCSPTRSSLMTGLRPDTTGVWDLNTHFRTNIPNTITLGQHLGTNGYRTYGLSKIYHIGYNDPPTWTDGWVNPNAPHTYYETANAAREDAGDSKAGATDCGDINPRDGNPVTDESYKDGIVVTNALERLHFYAENYHSNGTPFFLAVGFIKPHLPFTSPKKYWDLYSTNDIDVSTYDGTFHLPSNTLAFTAPGSTEPSSYTYIGETHSPTNKPPQLPSQAQHLIHGYLAAVSYTDANVGKLLDGLATNNVASNTIVVLWGDHGWHLGDHGAFWAKHSNFEQATHTLLMVSVPGMEAIGTAGKKCGAPVEFVDIYPTLVDLVGLPGPAQPPGLELQGQSFAPLLEDPNQPWKKGAISQYTRNISGAGVAHPGNGMGYSLRTVRYRYTEWWRTQTGANRAVKIYSTPEYAELYDYWADPAESTNFVAEPGYSNVVAEMKGMLAGGLGWGSENYKAPGVYPTNWTDWQAANVQPGYGMRDLSEGKDPDDDGLNNLEEYGLGLNPFVADTNPVVSQVQTMAGSNWLCLQFPKITDRQDVWLGGAQAGQLTNWTRAGVVNEVLTNGYPADIRRSRVPIITGGANQNFFRLEVERLP